MPNELILANYIKIQKQHFMIDKKGFIKRIKGLNSFESKTGKTYSNLLLNENILSFKRDSTGKYWDLDIDEVYHVYTKENYFNTVVIRKYLDVRVYSPALGLLMATGLCDKAGIRKIK